MNEEEQDLEDAEAAFLDEEAENNQQILTALGFTPHYHDKDSEGNDETNFGIRVMDMKIGVKFNDANPTGKVWAYTLTEENKKDFIKNGNLKQLPLVQRYLDIQAGKKPRPELIVIGRIIERRSKSALIEIEEEGEKKEIIFGWGAVKKHDDGHHFIPHGFSKPSQDNPEGKMCVPRDILLPEMDADTPNREEAEIQKIRREQGIAPALDKQAASGKRAPAAPEAVKSTPPTDSEIVDHYINLLASITKKVGKEERIPEKERGYAISKVFDAITRDRRSELIAELKNGAAEEGGV